jgi:hypothetical protein
MVIRHYLGAACSPLSLVSCPTRLALLLSPMSKTPQAAPFLLRLPQASIQLILLTSPWIGQ